MTSSIFWDFLPLPPHCHPFFYGVKSPFGRSPLPLSGRHHLWTAPHGKHVMCKFNLFAYLSGISVILINYNIESQKGAVPEHVGLAGSNNSPLFKVFWIARRSGNFSWFHSPLKLSVSIDQTMTPAISRKLANLTLLVTDSSLEYPIQYGPLTEKKYFDKKITSKLFKVARSS